MNPTTVDDELIDILKRSFSVDTKSQGWSYIVGMSATDDGLNHLISSNKYVPFIISSIQSEKDEGLIKLAFKSLINISAKEEGTLAIIKRKDFCNYLLNTICGPSPKFVQYKCYLLSNISTNAEAVEQIVLILLSSKGLYQELVNVYASDDVKLRSQYDFLTLVFANVSKVAAGRKLFLQDMDFLTSILKFLKPSEPESRRLGTAFILRNCCFETEYHDKLLHRIGILPALLLPLMVHQEYEKGGEMGELPPELQKRCLEEVKERDESASVRRVLVEALAILCYSEDVWRYLKTNGTYYVIRDLHAWETDEIAKEIIEQLVAYLLIVDYSKPSISECCSENDSGLIKQLEYDMTKDLPDFVLTGGTDGI